jgi:hypothetical protein
MKSHRLIASTLASFVFVLFAFTTVLSGQAQQSADAGAWKSVEDALGRKGSMQPGDVYKFSMPRSDMKVTVAGTPIKAGLALGSWLAFKRMGDSAMVMGDLVLTESEVDPVMKKLQQEGIEETALHNHLLNESPRVMYMHVAGHGDPAKLAASLKEALALTKPRRPRLLRVRRKGTLVSIPRASIKPWDAKEKTTMASISFPFHVRKRSTTWEWKCPLRWELQRPLTSSLPGTTKRP